ncbi:MAG: adenylate kinase [Caldilineae bacterium]|nr:MAG: adenylate kinase [Caldilineae bacterium]
MLTKQTYIVFLGPPGSGKGTQARILQKVVGLPHVATGDLFRHNISQQTELGRLAKRYIDAGELVPDDVTLGMVRDRLQQPDCAAGVIFDGFPRTLEQVVALDELLADRNGVVLALMLDVSDAEVTRRITGRRVCRNCGAVYHIEFNPPKQAGICDVDGGELYQRDDDKPETVRNRLYVYYKQTSPLIGYYFAKGLLVKVDGDAPPDRVTARLLKVLEEHGIKPVMEPSY